MSALPTHAGTYRIKVYNTGNDCYWKYKTETNRICRWIQLATLDKSDNAFNWSIAPDATNPNIITIKPAADTSVIFGSSNDNRDKYWGYGFPEGFVNQTGLLWTCKASPNNVYSTISFGNSSYVVDSVDTSSSKAVHFYSNQGTANQKWVFEEVRPSTVLPVLPRGKSFEDMFFTLTPAKAAEQEYDIIIVGTGIGGGIIAGDLFDTNSMLGEKALSVLVIEKGYLPFHSHCLNASRPTGFGEDRGQQNDTFFSLFRDDFNFSPETKVSDWKGGPMYNVGGRSAAWGLFVPRIHDSTLKSHFVVGNETWRTDLLRKWYREAETLMELSIPTTTPEHLNVMERLNMRNNGSTPSGVSDRGVQWEWGRIASEFSERANFEFAKGAYSTIDKILEIAMSKRRSADGTLEEHPNWKILLGSEVDQIIWADDGQKTAGGVVVRGPDGAKCNIRLKAGVSSKLVLAAGSVASPTILMRSGKRDFLARNGGLHVTDHDIFAKAYTFRFENLADQQRIGAMKLQTYVNINNEIILVNISVNADSFLPRTFLEGKFFRNTDYPKLILAFIRPCKLNDKNTIVLDSNNQPIVTINRSKPFNNSEKTLRDLRLVAIEIKEVLQETLNITIQDEDDDEDNFFKPLELGGVAHELGTIPMPGEKGQSYCVSSELSLRDHDNIFVCDLSVFPYSPEVNPTLTLAAMALRLSRETLLPLEPKSLVGDINPGDIVIHNQSGEKIQVFVSNQAGVALDKEDKLRKLGPGQFSTFSRKAGINESAMIYRLAYNEIDQYQTVPVLFVASPGRVTPIG